MSDFQGTQETIPTVVEKSALELMERANIDMQIATAHAYPRSMARFKQLANEMVSVDKETAESCIYSRPVGKDERGKPVFAKGESIRLAEIVAASYGNLRVQGMIVEMTPKFVKAVGVAHDLETNYAAKAEVVESTVTRNGSPMSERQRLVIAKAAQSKAIRDAVFRVVPKSLCKSIVTTATDVIFGKQRPLAERRQQVAAWIAKLNIDPKRVYGAVGVEGVDDLGDDELQLLTGIRTALTDGDTTLDDAFPPLAAEVETDKKGTQGLKDRLTPKTPPQTPTPPQKSNSAQPETNLTPPKGLHELDPDEIPFGRD